MVFFVVIVFFCRASHLHCLNPDKNYWATIYKDLLGLFGVRGYSATRSSWMSVAVANPGEQPPPRWRA